MEKDRKVERIKGVKLESLDIIAVIGQDPGTPQKNLPPTSYLLTTLNKAPQKYLTIVTEGSDEILFVEVDDVEEAGEQMFIHMERKYPVLMHP